MSQTPSSSSSPEVRWRWLQGRLRQDPAWIGHQGLRVVLVLLSCAALMTLVAPLWGVAILSLALAVMGLVVLCDFAVRGHSRIDPRLATLLLVAGVGNLLVVAVRLLWG